MKRIARFAALALVAGVGAVLPATAALAQTGILNVEPEVVERQVGDSTDPVVFTASVKDDIGAGVPGAAVHYRIESGPGATPPAHGPNGVGTLGCATEEDGSCDFTVPPATADGEQLIRTWVEDDGLPGPGGPTPIPEEADLDEPRDETTEEPPEPATGNDNTDVVQVNWTAAPEGIDLNVEPEAQPATTTPEEEPPPATQSAASSALGDATFTATVEEDGEPASGKKVNFTVTAGPNEGTTFDCTTGAEGTCTADYTGGPTEGTDTVRGVVDGETADEAEQADETTEGGAGDEEEIDATDVVEVTWTEGDPPPPPPTCMGTPEDDLLIGTDGDDTCRGGGGNDTINTKGGNDDAKGNGGNDKINLGPGNDDGNGGPGVDQLRGGPGRDDINGGGGKGDTTVGGSGKDDCKAETERSC